MEFTLKVVLTAEPALLAVLEKLATPPVHHTQYGPGSEVLNTNEPVTVGGESLDKILAAPKVTKVKKAAPVVPITEPITATEPVKKEPAATVTSAPELTISDVKALAVPLSQAGHKDKIIAKRKELDPSADSLNELGEQHFPAMIEWLKTLK